MILNHEGRKLAQALQLFREWEILSGLRFTYPAIVICSDCTGQLITSNEEEILQFDNPSELVAWFNGALHHLRKKEGEKG